LDRLEEFRRFAKKEGASLSESLIEEELRDEENGQQEPNNDRELIEEFMVKVRQVQAFLIQMQENNKKMKEVAEAVANENSSEKQQEITKELNSHMEKNQK